MAARDRNWGILAAIEASPCHIRSTQLFPLNCVVSAGRTMEFPFAFSFR
jgi:hypothetical protein